jgi:hypothetical protein
VAQWILALSTFVMGGCLAGLWDRRAFTRQEARYEQALRQARAEFEEHVLVERSRAETAISIVDRLTRSPITAEPARPADDPASQTAQRPSTASDAA